MYLTRSWVTVGLALLVLAGGTGDVIGAPANDNCFEAEWVGPWQTLGTLAGATNDGSATEGQPGQPEREEEERD